jgi:hypothetical protein
MEDLRKKNMFKEKALLSFIIKDWDVNFYYKHTLELRSVMVRSNVTFFFFFHIVEVGDTT